jgi:hypothetical protein
VAHIRIGDYKYQENSYIGILSADYYKACVKYLKENLGEKAIYVFSDEIDGARSMYSDAFPQNTFWVDPVGEYDPIEVLKLMSLANRFVIGNSTFGWWAAYMSKHCDCVLAPTKWFRSRQDPKELIPPSWIRIKSDWRET